MLITTAVKTSPFSFTIPLVSGTGAAEYLVQRFGSMYPFCYTAMTITCTMMAVIVYLMYKTTCAEREEPDYD